MSQISDYLEQKLLEHIFLNSGLAVPANVYVSLHTAPLLDDGTGTEVSGGSYARQAVSTSGGWTAVAVNGTAKKTDNASIILFPTASAPWGTVTHFGVWDAVSAGNLLFRGTLSASKVVGSGDTIRFAAGQLVVNLD